MAIQPIDLSTIYSQMDKIGHMTAAQMKAASAVNEQIIEKGVQLDFEKSHSVQEAKSNSESGKVNAEGHQGNTFSNPYGDSRKKQQQEEEESEVPQIVEFKDPYLGQRIDVTG